MTRLRKMMLEELERRNYSPRTIECYIPAVEDFARYFHRPPDQLGPAHIREYQAYLFRQRKLDPNTVNQRLAALRFFFVKTLRRPWSVEVTPYPKKVQRLPSVLSQEEVAQLINAAPTLPSGLGRLLQTALRGARICPSRSGRLYPSHRDLQPSPRFPDGRPSHLSLARLRPRQPAAPHDPVRAGVLATFSPPRTSPRLRAHPPLRFSGPSPPCSTSTPLFPTPAIGD